MVPTRARAVIAASLLLALMSGSAVAAPSWRMVATGPLFADAILEAVATGDGRLVAGGVVWDDDDWRAAAWTSRNGAGWARSWLPDGEGTLVRDMAYWRGQFWLVGERRGDGAMDAALYRSRDARRWTTVDLPASMSGASLLTVAPVGGRLLVAGCRAAGGSSCMFVSSLRAAAWSTSDGRRWEESTMSGSEMTFVEGVAKVGTRYVAAGTEIIVDDADGDVSALPVGAALWISNDGRSWDRLGGHAEDDFIVEGAHDVAAWGNRTVVVGFSDFCPQAWGAKRMESWVKALEPFDCPEWAEMMAVTRVGGMLVATGIVYSEQSEQGLPVWTSRDGRSWRRSAPGGPVAGYSAGWDVAAWRDRAVIVGAIERQGLSGGIWIGTPAR